MSTESGTQQKKRYVHAFGSQLRGPRGPFETHYAAAWTHGVTAMSHKWVPQKWDLVTSHNLTIPPLSRISRLLYVLSCRCDFMCIFPGSASSFTFRSPLWMSRLLLLRRATIWFQSYVLVFNRKCPAWNSAQDAYIARKRSQRRGDSVGWPIVVCIFGAGRFAFLFVEKKKASNRNIIFGSLLLQLKGLSRSIAMWIVLVSLRAFPRYNRAVLG